MQIGCANSGIYGAIVQEDPKIQYARGRIELARANPDLARRDIECPGRQHACCQALYIELNAKLVKCAIPE